MKKNNRLITLVLFIFLCSIKLTPSFAQETSIINNAKKYFRELDSLITIDNGKLWGVNLYGPTMFIVPETRLIIANVADLKNELTEKDGLFFGKLPDNINIANTSLEWNGLNWTMVNWNAISHDDRYYRDMLFIHESWHRVQNVIGINALMTSNSHLDELQGSILLKLEILALKKAIMAVELNEKEINLKNALIIRNYRQLLFPKNNENEFERHEGMAEYTAYKLCGLNEKIIPKVLNKQLEMYLNNEGLANSFAYITGPTYGFLLDGFDLSWIEQIRKGKNLPEIASQKANYEAQYDTSELKPLINELILFYGAESLIKNETKKFEEQQSLLNEYRQKFIHSNQLIIPNKNLSFSFNPQEKLIPIDESGVVYKTLRMTADWGILEVNNGILRSNDWQYFIISAPKSAFSGTITEPDYKIILNSDWEIKKTKNDTYIIIKKKSE